MAKKFHAVNRETGEHWKPAEGFKQYLVMYDSGCLAVVTQDFYTYINPLSPRYWKLVKHDSLRKPND